MHKRKNSPRQIEKLRPVAGQERIDILDNYVIQSSPSLHEIAGVLWAFPVLQITQILQKGFIVKVAIIGQPYRIRNTMTNHSF